MYDLIVVVQTKQYLQEAVNRGQVLLDKLEQHQFGSLEFWRGQGNDLRLAGDLALRQLQDTSAHEVMGLVRIRRCALDTTNRVLALMSSAVYFLKPRTPQDNPLPIEQEEIAATIELLNHAWKQSVYAEHATLTTITSLDPVAPVDATRRFLRQWLDAELKSHVHITQATHLREPACSGCSYVEYVRLLLQWLDAAERDGRLPGDSSDRVEEAIEHVTDHAGETYPIPMVDQLERSVLDACDQVGNGLEPAKLLRVIAWLALGRLDDERGIIAEATV